MKSTPTRRPPASSAGRTTSSVVPGYVVDSSTTSIPGRRWAATAATALSTAARFGAPCSVSGVGTQMTMELARAITAASAEAVNPPSSISASSASEMSSICERPAFRPRTTSAFRSNPVTRSPARTAAWDNGRPT